MSIFKRRGSPYYQTEFVCKGHRVSRSTCTTSRRDAEVFERRLRDETAKQATVVKIQPVLDLDSACGRYWKEHGRKLRWARDVERYLRYICCYLDKSTLLAELSDRDVTELVKALEEAGVGAYAINRCVVTLQCVHNHAAKRWKEAVTVIVWKTHKTKERDRLAWLSPPKAKALLLALPAHIERVVRFLLLTGIRRMEAFRLAWDDVDFDKATAMVTVKGGALREIVLEPEAVLLLQECPRDARYVFDTTNWRKHFEAAKVKVGEPDLRWHDLRHTVATWLGQQGVPLEVIRDVLGHSSVAVTMKYRHVIQREVRGALQKLPTLSPSSAKVVAMKKA